MFLKWYSLNRTNDLQPSNAGGDTSTTLDFRTDSDKATRFSCNIESNGFNSNARCMSLTAAGWNYKRKKKIKFKFRFFDFF